MEKKVTREKVEGNDKKIWACFMHLSFNFAGGIRNWGGLRDEFEPDMSTWDAAIDEMAAQGINMVLMNLDDSVLWDSHPEIALKNSWTPERLRIELDKIRKKGIEPIPVLNFAVTHDAWLGEYAKMVSTPAYYSVCSDLIAEAINIFDTPRFIHFGMDEEDYGHQKHFDYIVIRRQEIWWGNLAPDIVLIQMKHGIGTEKIYILTMVLNIDLKKVIQWLILVMDSPIHKRTSITLWKECLVMNPLY